MKQYTDGQAMFVDYAGVECEVLPEWLRPEGATRLFGWRSDIAVASAAAVSGGDAAGERTDGSANAVLAVETADDEKVGDESVSTA